MMLVSEKKDLTQPQQFLLLKASKIVDGEGDLHLRRLEWRFDAQPTPLSRTYRVTLVPVPRETPDVRIADPDLRVLSHGRELPHIYHNPDRLCLYLPGTGQWDASKRLDQTIVPWTHLWLIYFEEWLSSDDWKGGGQHPGDEPEAEGNRALRRRMQRLS
ncbi:MAG: hypothetical protein ABJO67_13585 [Pseudoruegeria sp.]